MKERAEMTPHRAKPAAVEQPRVGYDARLKRAWSAPGPCQLAARTRRLSAPEPTVSTGDDEHALARSKGIPPAAVAGTRDGLV